MVRRDEAGRSLPVSRCSSPAGASPVSVSAGAPSSRPQAPGEIPVAQAGCQKPRRRKPARGPQHYVKPAASTDLQPESRAGHFAAKAMSAVSQSGDAHAAGLGGVRGVARVQGDERNTRGPSAPPWSGQSTSYKPTAKSSCAQRESEGVVVPPIVVTNNAAGGKDLCFGRARYEGKCQGMAGKTGSNHSDAHARVVNAREPRHELWRPAKRLGVGRLQLRGDARGTICGVRVPGVHAGSGRPSVSRVPEIGMHGLKGGPALSPMTVIV
jgi:hypothetical protein